MQQAGHRFTVTQLGDFVDLWRQSNAMQTLRTEPDSDGQPAAPNLTVLVIGHTHHARLVVDHTAHRVLMDCGAWIESYQVDRAPKHPNRQLGAVCGADLRIYQFD